MSKKTKTSETILITGASAGIGKACVDAFAKSYPKKSTFILIARREERLKTHATRLERKGFYVHCFALDIADRKAVEKFARAYKKTLDQVTILVNNAGLAKGLEPLQEGSEDDWQTMLQTNVMGLLRMTRLISPSMIRRKSGHIVNIGSVASRWFYPNGNVYCATKAAVHAITESLRMDLNGSGVRVTEITPGKVETEFSLVRFGNEELAKKAYEGMTPLTAEDVAEAVVWCAQRPVHVNIQDIVLYPTDQASPTMIHLKKSAPSL